MNYKYTSRSEEDTIELAENIESEKFPGMVICLRGELGSGKTVFVKGFARSLEITETVTSPTFSLVKEYNDGQMPLYHMDLYRLEDTPNNKIGVADYFNSDGICILEWPEMIEDQLPEERLDIKFKVMEDDTRILICTPYGQKYEDLCEAVFVVLFKDGKVLDEEIVKSTLRHSVITMPSIQKLIERNNITVNDINEVIVCNGPGSFTGVRIGVTIGKTMAYLRNVPIKVIDSLMVKYISLNSDDEKYVVIEDKNGAYVDHFDKGPKVLEEYKYLPNSEYKEFKKGNEVVDEVEINYELIYKYLTTVKAMNAHEVKPLYIKGIDALK